MNEHPQHPLRLLAPPRTAELDGTSGGVSGSATGGVGVSTRHVGATTGPLSDRLFAEAQIRLLRRNVVSYRPRSLRARLVAALRRSFPLSLGGFKAGW